MSLAQCIQKSHLECNITPTKMSNNEEFKFFIASQLQSYATILLNSLLDKKFNNQTASSATSKCRSELIKLSSNAVRNEHWALKGE